MEETAVEEGNVVATLEGITHAIHRTLRDLEINPGQAFRIAEAYR